MKSPSAVVVLVVVLGNIAQSPRMKNHLEQLHANGFYVQLLAYQDDEEETPKCQQFINIHKYKSMDKISPYLKIPFAFIKILLLMMYLLYASLWLLRKKPSVVFSQNPPSLPTFLLCLILKWLYSCRWIIDWHNYGHSILALSEAPSSLSLIYQFLEFQLGRLANHHLCVTAAMGQDLRRRLHLRGAGADKITICYDLPNSSFCRLSQDARYLNLRAISRKFPRLEGINFVKTKVLMSSTSWTIDEDFTILIKALHHIEALKLYEEPLIVFITGKGPMKKSFEDMVSEKFWKNIIVICSWFSFQDYSLLLGSADLGLCFHTSSSGLDFPMKLVDMIGAELPFLALKFPAFEEFVLDSQNCTFLDAVELADKIIAHLYHTPAIKSFKPSVWRTSWTRQWEDSVLPKFILQTP